MSVLPGSMSVHCSAYRGQKRTSDPLWSYSDFETLGTEHAPSRRAPSALH